MEAAFREKDRIFAKEASEISKAVYSAMHHLIDQVVKEVIVLVEQGKFTKTSRNEYMFNENIIVSINSIDWTPLKNYRDIDICTTLALYIKLNLKIGHNLELSDIDIWDIYQAITPISIPDVLICLVPVTFPIAAYVFFYRRYGLEKGMRRLNISFKFSRIM